MKLSEAGTGIPILWRVGWRWLIRRPWQTFLMILGIALGVAVVVSIDLANASAARAFQLSTEMVTGRATHQITGGPQGIDEKIFLQVKDNPRVKAAAPVMTEYITSPELGGQPLQLLGIDPFSEPPFRSYLGGGNIPNTSQLTQFLTEPGAVILSSDNAKRNNLQIGDHLTLVVEGRPETGVLVGILEPQDTLSKQTIDGLILADIATVQELTGRLGKLDRIDLIFNPGVENPETQLQKELPTGVDVSSVAARSGAVMQMSEAFNINLSALSLLALLVGLFLIYNSMTFAVVQRRALFGSLRCLGITRREIFSIVLNEALAVGVLGSIFGIFLGLALGQITVRMITQTINDLYFTTTVRDVGIPISSLVKGGLLGIFATIATAIPPAWEAASIPPRAALSRSGLETKARRAVLQTALGGLFFIGLGLGVFAIPSNSLTTGFGGTLAITIGFAMLAALTMVILVRGALPITGKIFGLLGRMAPRNLINSLSRTSIAVAALMVAVAVTVAVSLMIASFRYTVIVWLGQTLQGDIYISAPGFTETTARTIIDPRVAPTMEALPGLRRVDLVRVTSIDSSKGPVQLFVTTNPNTGKERYYVSLAQSAAETWQEMQQNAVLVSEPLANRWQIPKTGGQVVLNTPEGLKTFRVIGIFYDYSSSQGEIVMSRSVYTSLWNDNSVTAIDLFLQPGVNVNEVNQLAQDAIGKLGIDQHLLVRPNSELRRDVMAVFDRTFAITGALNILSTIVAFMGVLSSLLLLQLEKQREVGILRAIGLTARQLWGLVSIESGLMGLVAGILAMPTGYALSLILIYVINKRSFGWTLQMDLQASPFAQGLAISLIAALLAGIYPAYKLGKMVAAEAIRYE